MNNKCALCGKSKDNHKAKTLHCPMGKKSPTVGYTTFHHSNVFTASKSPMRENIITISFIEWRSVSTPPPYGARVWFLVYGTSFCIGTREEGKMWADETRFAEHGCVQRFYEHQVTHWTYEPTFDLRH